MPVEKSYARLGLFLVVAVVVIFATTLFFIQQWRSRAVIEMVTFTRDNVAGIDISSPVRYRGVPIGRVSDVRVDPRGQTIEIDFEVFLDRLNTIGANVTQIRQVSDLGGMFQTLRAQVVGNPVTGEAYLLIDRPDNPPPPLALSFTPARPYIPSMSSPFATVRDRLPALVDRAEETLHTLEEIVGRIPDSLDRSNHFFASIERIVEASDLPALSADSRKFFATTSAQIEVSSDRIEKMTTDLDRLLGEEGTFASFIQETRAAMKDSDLPATNKAARDAFDRTSLAADDLRRSLPAIYESLNQLRTLARQLEEQPESVVYGPRPPEKHR